MSRRNSRRRQQAMNARRPRLPALEWLGGHDWWKAIPPAHKAALRVVEADPDTFPWYRGFGAGPVFYRMDGSAVGPMLVEEKHDAHGGTLTRWEVVEVRPPMRRPVPVPG